MLKRIMFKGFAWNIVLFSISSPNDVNIGLRTQIIFSFDRLISTALLLLPCFFEVILALYLWLFSVWDYIILSTMGH